MKTSIIPIILTICFLPLFSLKTKKFIKSKDYGDTTRIYIENLSSKHLAFSINSVVEEVNKPDIFTKIYDTLTIIHKLPFNLATTDIDTNRNYIHSTFIVNSGERIHLKKLLYETKVYVDGDTLRNNELQFFSSMQQRLGNYEGFMVDLPFKKSLPEVRLQKIKDLYTQRVQFLDEYSDTNPMSKKFKERVTNMFYYRQYSDYFSLYGDNKEFKSKYKKSKAISEFIKQFSINDVHYDIVEYGNALQAKLFIESPDVNNYLNLYNKAKQDFKGLSLEVLLCKVIESSERSPQSSGLVRNYLKIAQQKQFKNAILSKYGQGTVINELTNSNSTIDKAILVKMEKQKVVLWNELIADGKIKYLDFWASWCGGCRLEIPSSKKLKAEYAMKGIDFVYISMDQNGGAWKKASQKEDLPDVNSYILPNSKKSAIAKQFNILTIPRYILIGKDGKVINADAPRPSDPKIRKMFDELLKK